MQSEQDIILGGGMTGLAAGWASNLPVYEAATSPGGICSSYYIEPGSRERLRTASSNGEVYRFEIGGGHWIFGGDPTILKFIDELAPVKSYSRQSSVFFPSTEQFVPYPLQNHLRYLDKKLLLAALTEVINTPDIPVSTMEEWIKKSFGSTLSQEFFGPFHDLYTAGLWRKIAPQDPYKSPIDTKLLLKGAIEDVPAVGYNVTFVYPKMGLNSLAQRMAARCNIHYGKRVVSVDTPHKIVTFSDGTSQAYRNLISTLPIHIHLSWF